MFKSEFPIIHGGSLSAENPAPDVRDCGLWQFTFWMTRPGERHQSALVELSGFAMAGCVTGRAHRWYNTGGIAAMNRTMRSIVGVAAVACATVASPAHAGWIFTNFSLGGPDGAAGTTINGINNNGSVVGFGQSSSGVFTNFAGPPGVPTLLNIAGSTTAMANGINDSNQVVGTVNGQAFSLFNNFQNFFMLNPASGATSETAFGINNGGLIVGQYATASGTLTPGFVYNDGAYTTLQPVSPVGGVLVVNAQGINNNGIVAGFYSTNNTTMPIDGNEPQHGFLYNTNTGTYRLVPDPTVPSGNTFFTTQLLGINDKGIVSGYVQDTKGDQFGFLYNSNTNSYTYLNDPDAALINGVQMTQITGINNSGEITGFYINSQGLAEGFVATQSVPEPASLALLGIGVAGIACVAYTRRRRMKAAS
jgi:hypothetical protein